VADLDAAEDVVHTLRRRLRLPAAYLLGIGYTGRYFQRSVANSLGLSLAHWQTGHEVWCWLEGAGGHVRLGASGATLAELAPDRLAAELLEQAGCLTAAPAVSEGTLPVLFGPLAAADLAGAFARLLCGQHLLGDLGVLRERMGRRIASPQVTLIDEAIGPFDDEGTPAGPVTLIEQGRLRGVLQSLETAHGLDMAPNGRARRAELSAPPAPAPARACLAAGNATPEELADELGTGPLLTGLLTAGRVRSGTGRFNAIGYGWWLRRGVPVRRISGVAVSSGVFELLRSVVACGNDLRFAPLAGGTGAPSVLISGMRVD
jgi:PmbA protein